MASIGERGACSWPAEEYGRARHQAQRIRILTGLWREDIILALSRIYSAARAEAPKASQWTVWMVPAPAGGASAIVAASARRGMAAAVAGLVMGGIAEC